MVCVGDNKLHHVERSIAVKKWSTMINRSNLLREGAPESGDRPLFEHTPNGFVFFGGGRMAYDFENLDNVDLIVGDCYELLVEQWEGCLVLRLGSLLKV